jgi:hypothetical protein
MQICSLDEIKLAYDKLKKYILNQSNKDKETFKAKTM